ncbi:MAG TPA: hypothetical protein VF717_06575 [Pyrinomonadaceae bacterium]|jgi:hypothetical protein
MAPDTGHVIDTKVHGLPAGYTRLPSELQSAGARFLKGRSEGHISLKSGGKLSRFAQGERRKSRARMAKESRRRNRR